MGGLLTVQPFLNRYPQINGLDPAQTSFHTAWVIGESRTLHASISTTDHGTGLAVGSWHLGCLVSAILCIFISDSLGRRRTLLLGITIWTIGEIIQTSSYSFAQFIVGRGIAGFGTHTPFRSFLETVIKEYR
jgi:MFS family permease